MQGLQAGPQAEQVQCKVHALAVCREIGKWSASMASSTWPPALHGPHHCVYTAHAIASGSAAVVTARVNTSPSQESRKVCSQLPPGFLPAGTGRWLWITARLRSCDFRPVTLNPHLPGPRCPEPHTLVPKCLSSEAMPQTRGQSSFPCGLPTGAAELGWAAIFTDAVPFQLQTLTLEVDDVSVAAADAHMGPAPASGGGHQP